MLSEDAHNSDIENSRFPALSATFLKSEKTVEEKNMNARFLPTLRKSGRANRNLDRNSKAYITAVIASLACLGSVFVRIQAFAQAPAVVRSVPIRWCVVANDKNNNGRFDAGEDGAPAFTNPGNVGERDTDSVLWRRHERTTDATYLPQANVTFRSALYNVVEDPTLRFPIIPDQGDPTIGRPGDVLSPSFDAGKEWNKTLNECMRRWSVDNRVENIGIVAVVARKIVASDGNPLNQFGQAWAAGEEGVNTARVLVEDNAFSLPGSPLNEPDPDDAVDKLLGHEIGHALPTQMTTVTTARNGLGHVCSTAQGGQDDNLMRQGRIDLSDPKDGVLDNFRLSNRVAQIISRTARCESRPPTELIDQIRAVFEAAQKIPGCTILGTNTPCSLMSDVQTDAVQEFEDRFPDISMLFVTESGPNTSFAHELF
jgi:hypothetical protein